MIKNLVFDLGNVLVEFKPKDYMDRLGFSTEDIDSLFQIIFKDTRWSEFDRGTLKIEEYTSALKVEHPEYKAQIEQMFSGNWTANFLKPKHESIQFLKKAASNYRIYILSNVSEYVLNYVKTLGFWDKVTSGTYSYMIHCLKPEPEIYKAFFKDNNVIPEECLFLDDLPQNIAASERAGMKGIVFCDNLEDVYQTLDSDINL
ncbi:MAG: HAD family phosphatase [Clostridia bacterium]|nr:HAD family phosphatase [Clostridia bacterium]